MNITRMIHAEYQIFFIAFITVLIIIAYGTFRCKTTTFTDPLTFSLFSGALKEYSDGWALSHFLYNMLLGYMFPNKILFIVILGISWEILESLFKDHPFYLSRCKYTMQTDAEGSWWYGRTADIWVNIAGMFAGIYFSSKKMALI